VLQIKGDTAVWAMHSFPMSTPIEWSTSRVELKAKYIPSNALDLVKRQWEELSLKEGECVTEFNERFSRLCSKLELHQPMPTDMLADAYVYKIEQGNQGVYIDQVRYISMHDMTLTLEQHMEHLAEFGRSLTKSPARSGAGANTNTTTNISAMNLDCKKGGTNCTVGTAKDNSLTCYNCG